MNAIILSIGDELALGQTVDTNSAWIAGRLASVGCDVAAHLTVPDKQQAIEQAILESVGRCDFLVISGGIGPTEDDLTRQALAAVFDVPLEPNEKWLAKLHEFFAARGRPMPETNKIQAMIPRGTKMIENTAGTAAGIDATYQSPDQKTVCRTFVMPGVPKEMKIMFMRDVLPHIQRQTGGAVILSRTLHTFGLGESWVAERLGDLMKRDRNPSVGTTVSGGIVSIRINARSDSAEHAQSELDATTRACETCLGDIIFGQDEQSLAEVLAASLASSRQTIATAESCTGGLLAKMLTDIPGSSAYFKQGWVTYSNKAKHALLNVPTELLEKHGAVSEPVVQSMATNARQLAHGDFAVAVSGVAGPTGGTPAKPVGTVCLALAHPTGVISRTFNFPGDREMIRDRAAKMALAMLRYHLLNKPLPF